MITRPGIRHRNLVKQHHDAEMRTINTILKNELRERWEENQELKNLCALLDKDLLKLKDLDSTETVAAVKAYKAKRFN
jgi:hypothetical protein